MGRKESEETKKQNKIKFIRVTQDLLETTSAKDISIRKIADEAGFHNSTIYLYFSDIDRLLALASVKYFQKYATALSEVDEKDYSAYDYFIKVWEIFCECAFDEADIYYAFFFGKHGDDITSILNEYYDLFPEEKKIMTRHLEKMYFGKNISDRCLILMEPIVCDPSTGLDWVNYDIANSITVCYLKNILFELTTNSSKTPKEATEELLEVVKYSIRK